MTARSDTSRSELRLSAPGIPVAAVFFVLLLVPILPLSALGPLTFCLTLGLSGSALARTIGRKHSHMMALVCLAALFGTVVAVEGLLGIAAVSTIPVLIPLFCALTLGLYALEFLLADDRVRRPFLWGAFALAAGLSHVAAQFTLLSAPLVVTVLLYALCLAIFLRLWQQWNRPYTPAEISQTRPSVAETLSGSLDILCVGLFLDPLSCALYLIPRCVAGLLQAVYFPLEHHLGETLMRGRSTLSPSAEAARVNLGFLLIGGASALLLCLMTPIVLAGLTPSFAPMLPVFYWLVLGQSAPALFGAGPLLMKIWGLEVHYARLSWALIPIGIGILAWGVFYERLAQAMAVFLLTKGAICAAVLVYKRGIWPGLTVLLHKRLRL